LSPAEVRSILVVELTRLGDFLVVLPSIRALRLYYPNSSITVVIDARYKTFLMAIEPSVSILELDRDFPLFPFLGVMQKIRARHFDLACSMSPARRNAFLVLASGAPRKVGYLTTLNSLTPYLHSTPVQAFGCRASRHVVFGCESLAARPAKVLETLGIPSVVEGRILSLPEAPVRPNGGILESIGLTPESRFAAVHPFSGWEYRTWGSHKFEALSKLLVDRLGLRVVVLCSKEEEERLAVLREAFAGNPNVHFLPSANLLDTARVIDASTVFVGNDSGPLHLAAMLEVPSVGLFGPASPELTGPRSSNLITVYKQVDCSPCDQKECVRPEHSCMALIEPEEVFLAVEQLVRSRTPARTVKNV